METKLKKLLLGNTSPVTICSIKKHYPQNTFQFPPLSCGDTPEELYVGRILRTKLCISCNLDEHPTKTFITENRSSAIREASSIAKLLQLRMIEKRHWYKMFESTPITLTTDM